MSVFIRRFTSDPGNDVLLDIESVNILDLTPPGVISGVGAGTALLVGEFENGPFETTEEVTSSVDLAQRYGSFGYIYAGVAANNPSARSRKVDGTLTPEYWNGNAAVALNGKRFRRLLVSRVDTSVGSVEFSRHCSISATLPGGTDQTFNLEPNEYFTLVTGDNAGIPTNIGGQFLAAAANLVSGAGVYPTLFVGGETLVLNIDSGTPLALGPITVTFQATDQLRADVIARINAAAGFALASAGAVNVIEFDGRVRGLLGQVEVVSASASVLAALNIAVGSTLGTGNVGNIDAVTVDEINALFTGSGFALDRDSNGALRIYAETPTTATWLAAFNIAVSFPGSANATGLGFDFGSFFGPMASQPDGFAQFDIAGTYPSGFAGGEAMVVGVDDEPDVTIIFAATDQTAAQVAARVNAAMGYQFMTVGAGFETFRGRANGGQIRLVSQNPVGPGSPFDVIFAAPPTPATFQAAANEAVTIPAGTPVKNTAGTQTWVTMQDVAVRASGASASGQAASGPYSVKVRPATDDGTALGSAAGTLTQLPLPFDTVYFSVTNPAAVSVALTEGQIDAAYTRAIQATVSVDTVACEANLVWSARQSNAIRNALRQNAIDASANGCFGRTAVVRPPLGTTRATAKSAGQPGVNAYRDQRVVYTFPGVQTFVPPIAARGLSGGAGFTADGVVNAGADGFLVSVCSQLAPEENPGQETPFTLGALGLESGNADVLNMGISDYISFRASGICAPRMDGGRLIFQSGVTSVNPATYPQLRNIARRRMADFIQDSLAVLLKGFGKKLSTPSRRAAIVSAIRSFMNALLSPGNAAAQRIDGFRLDPVSGNTPETLALGLFRVILDVRTLASLDSIVLQTTIGEQVDVSEAA